jgi:hypothetical protein
LAIARSNSYEVNSRIERFIQEVPALKLQAYNSTHEKPPSRAALGARAFSIGKRQQNGPPRFKGLEEAIAKIHVFCAQAAAIRLRKSVEASPTSGCSELLK